MSFGFGSGSSGFGQNNNSTQGTGFGFGATNNNTTSGFGTGSTGFGSTNNTSGGGLFGGSSSGFGGSGGFGTGGGAFGAKTGTFGAPATTSSGSIFGNTPTASNTSTGFGGFGGTNNSTSTGFGSSSGGLFGAAASKPAFGAASTNTTNPFGGTPGTSFGGTTTGAFGAAGGSALGGNVGECQGTGSVPFQPFVEKEPNSTSNQQNSFQSISFQQPYQKFSPEELRLADYAQGRKFGNANGQAGAFGQTTGFGGFGANTNTSSGFGTSTTANTGSGGLFGGASSNPFGGTSTASTGFGSTTTTSGGGLFGNNNSGGGLFGAKPSTPAQTGGGLFGSTSNTTSAFGGGNTTTTGGFGGGNSLFGNNNTNNANKGFSFGTTPSSGTTGFGTTATAGGAFGGGSTGGGLFGNAGQQNTSSPFGGNQQQNTSTTFGAFGTTPQNQTGGTSLFGNNNAAKPAGGLFGNTSTNTGGGGLFGNSGTATATPFGAAAGTQNAGGGLFGAAKPATTGGLFGNTGGTTTTPFSGFGQNNTNNQQQSTGLFGATNNNNQQKPSLFGNTQSGSSLFGGSGTQQGGNSLFGAQPQQQNQNSLFGNSLGNSQQSQQTPTQSLTASISDSAAYGGASLFSGLASTQVNNPGPLATPLSSSVKQKKTAALPLYKLNSASTSRFTTPQKRIGYGFSYSTYGTPGSVSSASSTPGAFSGSTFGNSFGRTLSKSVSTSSLRRSFGPTEDSIFSPGAFSASPSTRYYGSAGSVKKLNINRGLRTDLFAQPNAQQPSTPGILKKRVSFDPNGNSNGVPTSSPLKDVTNGSSPTSKELGLIRPASNGNKTVPAPAASGSTPEMSQIQGNELAVVPENEPSAPAPQRPASLINHEDPQPGEYWTEPSMEEIENMNQAQRRSVSGFKVGRRGIGYIEFNAPVDLSGIKLDELLDGIVQLVPRSATVYPISAKKPLPGKGLNVPATIHLENSWPRNNKKKVADRSSNGTKKLIDKHIERLKRVTDTEFVDYDEEKGLWTFKVEHFTTYGEPEDDDDDEMDGVSDFGQSTLSAPPDTPTPKTNRMNESFASTSQLTQTESEPEDTFDFRRKKVVLPGAFDEQEAFMEKVEDEESFLDERSAGSQSEDDVEEPMDQDDVFQDNESVSIMDQDMAGAYPQADNTAELDEDSQDDDDDDDMAMEMHTPGALGRARLRAMQRSETPSKRSFAAGNDWAAALRTTISPKKQDRALLKSLIDVHDNEPRGDAQPTPLPKRVISDGRGFATSIDLMNSLFGQNKSPAKTAKVPAKGKGFEWPYAKRPKTADTDMSNMTDDETAFHESMRPSWGPDGTLVYAAPPDNKPFGRDSRRAREKNGILTVQKGSVVSEGRDIRFAKFSNEASADFLRKQKSITVIELDKEQVPSATLKDGFCLSDFYDSRDMRDPASRHEELVWELASVLFDNVPITIDIEGVQSLEDRIRKDNLSMFWQNLVDDASARHVALAKSSEEKAIASLSGHKVADACGHLVNGKNYRLASLVALIGSQDGLKKDIKQQLGDWQKQRVLSEISEPIRAIYELLAGNVCVCDGTKGMAPEDRVESFVISKRFGLDWRQAFGLRLWYGCLPNDDLDKAVASFAEDIAQQKETSGPLAWYVEEKIPALWDDEDREEREDLLWGLLKLYVFKDSPPEEALCPENSQLSPLDFRLMWQLSQALSQLDAILLAPVKADEITLSFASQLTTEGSWLDAIFVLLHLHDIDARKKAIVDQLGHFAGRIGSESSQTFVMLTQIYKIPSSWIWEAKALYMRSVEKDPRAEVECLVRAKSFNEAHRTFSREVAPKAVVELDFDTLRDLLNGFKDKENMISEWHLGGQIYIDFLELVDCEKKSRGIERQVLERLLVGLPAVVEESRNPGFMETVATETISTAVAKAVKTNGSKSDLAKILQLPLTEDKYLQHTVGLSLEYYRSAMAAK